MSSVSKQLSNSIKKLDDWISSNGWAGYDPYDIQCAFFIHKIGDRSKFFRRLHSYIFAVSNKKFPREARKILNIKPQINAKGMGLFTEAYTILYKETKEINFLKKAKLAAKWLLENPNNEYENLCWGYPFDWKSKIFFPKGTPSSVVSTTIGRGLFELYQVTKDKKYIDACYSICNFILKDLNVVKNENGLCFSYTPLDNYQVHNANLFCAEFLVKIGHEIKDKKLIKRGLEAANFTIAEQTKEGYICYWSKDSRAFWNIPCTHDHYHCGFETRMLYGIWEITRNERIKKAADKYYSYYFENFFGKDYAPVLVPKSKIQTIDIHSCSEALILNSLATKYNEKSKALLENILNWVIKNMQTEDGYFIYRQTRSSKKTVRIDMPYLRWGQAWMLLGLSKTLQIMNEKER
ncbi:MAG: hypothetical protein ACTSSK_04340 [Candidatus Heimdallarchaeota archaeon]